MEIEEIYKILEQNLKLSSILKKESMSKHTTFKVGGKADIYVKGKSIEDIKRVLAISKLYNIPLTIIGNGSNILVKDKGIRGIVLEIALDNYQIQYKRDKAVIIAEAGVKLANLANILCKEGITGFEFASGIPGTIGGAVRMNAGAHGREMSNCVVSTTYIDFEGEIKKISRKQQKFSYRNSIFSNNIGIILQVTMYLNYGDKEQIEQTMKEYRSYRKEKQPISYPSAGSTFKRGKDYISAQLIDECGLKGYKVGGAEVSELHAGFVVNKGKATAEDVLAVIKNVTDTVYKKYGKKLELEIEVLGE